MAPTTSTKTKKAASGAPSQYHKTGRKGKKAWRKNVDLDEVEEGMEEVRNEEATVGIAIQKQPNEKLFTVDATGDEAVRKTLPKKLTHAQKVLAQRSAVPPLHSFVAPTPSEKRRAQLTYQQRERLLRITGRSAKGPLGTLRNPRDKSSEGVGLAAEKRKPPTVDIWSEVPEDVKFVSGLREGDQKDYLPELVLKPKMKPPKTDAALRSIALKPVVDPHAGTSYNPPVTAHQDLLRTALTVEEEREAARLLIKERKERAKEVGKMLDSKAGQVEPVNGMPIAPIVEDAEETASSEVKLEESKKQPKPKSKRSRLAVTRLKQESNARLIMLRRKKLLHNINFTKQITRTVEQRLADEQAALERKRKQRAEFYKDGLASKRMGSKYKAEKGEIDVQLSEDLSESLRGLKVEGNLFRDRFLSLQQRGLVETRSPVSRRRTKPRGNYKMVEKRAWKEFT